MKKILKSVLLLSLVSSLAAPAVMAKRESRHGYQGIEDGRAQIFAANNIVHVATKADLYEFTSKGFGFLKCADYSINQAGGPDNPIIDIQMPGPIRNLVQQANPDKQLPSSPHSFNGATVEAGGALAFMDGLTLPDELIGPVCGVTPTLIPGMRVSLHVDEFEDNLIQNGMIISHRTLGGRLDRAHQWPRRRFDGTIIPGKTFTLDDTLVIDMRREERDNDVFIPKKCTANGLIPEGGQNQGDGDNCMLPDGNIRIVDKSMGRWMLGKDRIDFTFFTDYSVGLLLRRTGNVVNDYNFKDQVYNNLQEVDVLAMFPEGMEVTIKVVPNEG